MILGTKNYLVRLISQMPHLISRKDEFLTKVIHNIEENLANEHYSVDELAEGVGLSRSMLHRKLIKLTGKSASDMITQIRLEKARELLENDVGTSSEIAFRVGFNSASYFNKVFKKYYRVSPGEFRKNPENFTTSYSENKESDFISDRKEGRKISIKKGWKIAAWISFMIIIGLLALYIINGIRTAKDISGLNKTIAVLPFENFSAESDESHLGDGIANEIANQLAKIRSFEVRSFTSSLQYKGNLKPSMPEIGKELNANFIVEGSVELQNSDIYINVQIIEANNDRHIWADDFKGNWDEILAIRANIAKSLAINLKTILSQEEIKEIEAKPTENPNAYNYYLRGNVFYSKSFEKQDWINALNMYIKAVEIDPQFAIPYTMMARTYLKLYWFHEDRSSIILEKAREAIEAALEINPESGEAYLAYGIYYYHGF